MTYTYEWTSAEESSLRRTDEEGNVAFVPVAPGNRDYEKFVASGGVATAYVAPAEPAPLTTEEKVNRLLTDYDLTRTELLSVVTR